MGQPLGWGLCLKIVSINQQGNLNTKFTLVSWPFYTAVQTLFAPASNVVFLAWMHILGGGGVGGMIPYIAVCTCIVSSTQNEKIAHI